MGNSELEQCAPSLPDVQRKIWASTAGLNLVGALIVFLYLTVIDPLPQGSASIQTITPVRLIIFLSVIGLTFLSGTLWRQRTHQRIARGYSFVVEGGSGKDIPL